MVITGMTKEMCQSALEAAAGDPNVAYDYLSSGNVPEKKKAKVIKISPIVKQLINSPGFEPIRQRLLTDPGYFQ